MSNKDNNIIIVHNVRLNWVYLDVDPAKSGRKYRNEASLMFLHNDRQIDVIKDKSRDLSQQVLFKPCVPRFMRNEDRDIPDEALDGLTLVSSNNNLPIILRDERNMSVSPNTERARELFYNGVYANAVVKLVPFKVEDDGVVKKGVKLGLLGLTFVKHAKRLASGAERANALALAETAELLDTAYKSNNALPAQTYHSAESLGAPQQSRQGYQQRDNQGHTYQHEPAQKPASKYDEFDNDIPF